MLIILLGSIFTTGVAQAKEAVQTATTPLSQVSCGSITAATYPAFNEAQTAVLPANGAGYAGAILAPSDGMTVTVGSQVARKYATPNANMWQRQISASNQVSITTSSGPDNVWAAYTAGSDFVTVRESLGDASLYDVYEMLKFGIVVDEEATQICFMGAFNDQSGPDIVFQVWNGLTKIWEKRVNVSEIDETLDLISAEFNAPIGTKLDVVVTVLENSNQLRQEYFLAGFGLDGAHLEDDDGDGNPNPTDPDPTTPRQCIVNVSSTDPIYISLPMFIDVAFSGDCGNGGIISFPPGALTKVERSKPMGELADQGFIDPSCFDTGDMRVICELGEYSRFRIHLVPDRLGTWTGKVTLSLDALAFQYWNGQWEVLIRFLLPVIAR
jgi:hypothetical protein